MQEERWNEVARLLEGAMELDASQRSRFVMEQTADPDLRAELLSLIENAQDEWLDRPVQIPASLVRDPLVGVEAGNCRLVRVLGEGGMGTVYEALRVLRLPGDGGTAEQRVAVKVWHRGSLNLPEMRREAALLARLEHSGIARLLDTGQLPGGQPFLVMELVEGEPLPKFAAGKTDAEKLELIGGICEAVEAAHRALIAHRDIKPGNVLVTRDGKPKLLDFGIGKSMDDMGRTTDLRLTPRYASPEQLRGATITTATDIYSLGVVMYELLAGVHPFGDRMGLDLARAICEEPVTPPAIGTDLASIVLKAMAREPADRYPSALALREDIGRYLRGEPVAAVNATARYRVSKFIRRQRVPLLVGAAVVVLVGAGFGRAYWEARQAARRFEQVRGLARSLVFEIHDEVSKVPGTLESRKLILARALQYLDQLSTDPSAEDDLQKDLAESYLKIGMVQGNLVRSLESLGRFQDARASYEKGVAILERLTARHPNDRELRLNLAKGIDRLAAACTRLDDEACAARARARVLEIYAGDARQNPEDFMSQARWLTARIGTLEPLVAKQEYQKLRDGLHEIATAFEQLENKHPKENKLGEFVAYSFKRLGAVEAKLGHYATGIGWYRKAQEIHRRSGDRMGESTCEVDIAWAEDQNHNHEAALEALDRAIAIRRELAEGRGSDQQSKLSLTSATSRKARILQRQEKWAESLPLLEEADALLRPLYTETRQNPQIDLMLAEVRVMRGDTLWALRRERDAKVSYQQGLRIWGKPLETLVSATDAARIQKRLGGGPSSAPATPSR